MPHTHNKEFSGCTFFGKTTVTYLIGIMTFRNPLQYRFNNRWNIEQNSWTKPYPRKPFHGLKHDWDRSTETVASFINVLTLFSFAVHTFWWFLFACIRPLPILPSLARQLVLHFCTLCSQLQFVILRVDGLLGQWFLNALTWRAWDNACYHAISWCYPHPYPWPMRRTSP